MTRGVPFKTLEQRLAKKTHRDGACLIWDGFCANGTNPSIDWRGQSTNVRRLVLLESTHNPEEREIIKNRTMTPWVTCGNRLCVERAHIFMMPMGEFQRMVAPRNGPPKAAILSNERRAVARRLALEEQAKRAESDSAIHDAVREALEQGTMAQQFAIRNASVFNLGLGLS